MMNKEITVKYNTSVYTPAGWRPVEVTAVANQISPKRCVVSQVLDINGDGNTGYASRTGAKRQIYHCRGVSLREEGKIKNISSLTVIE
jgi:hypothetical protein